MHSPPGHGHYFNDEPDKSKVFVTLPGASSPLAEEALLIPNFVSG